MMNMVSPFGKRGVVVFALVVCALVVLGERVVAGPPRPEWAPAAVEADEVTLCISADTGTEDPTAIYNGDRITFTITVENRYAVTVTEVHVNVSLAQDTLDEIACPSTAVYTCTRKSESHTLPEPSGGMIVVTSTSDLTWATTPLSPGGRITLTFSGQVIGQPEGAEFSHSASVYYYLNGDYHTVNSNILTIVAHVPIEEGGTSISKVPTWFSDDVGGTIDQDWGDFDLDGDLDLALGSSLGASVYRNDDGYLSYLWTSPSGGEGGYRLSYGVRWADVSASHPGLELVVVGDSADDTATGYGINYIYGYDSAAREFVQTGYFTTTYQLVRVEPGDYDGDGDVDLVASTNAINAPCPVALFRNEDGQFSGFASGGDDHSVECLGQEATAALAPADYDRDGDLDLVLGVFPDGLRVLVNTGNGSPVTDRNPFDVDNPVDVESGLEYIPYDMAWGDFDRDGYLDLAAAYPLQREVRVYRGVGGGALTPLTQTLHTVPFMTPLAVDWADFDGDGGLDLAVADSPIRIYGYLTATHTFTPLASSLSLPVNRGQVWSLRGVDVSNRGDMYLSLSNRDGSSHIFTAIAPRLKRSVTPAGMAQAGSVAWGDADGDGLLDLLLGAPPVESGSGLFLNRDGELETEHTFRHSGYGPHAVAFGDVTGDGRLDVAIGTPTDLQIYHNGNYDDAPDWSVASESIVRSLAWGDVDDDGHLDLLVGLDDGTVALYLNEGTGLAVTPAFTVAAEGSVRALAWGDFDGDFYLDFAVGADGGPLAVYRNQGDGSFRRVWESPEAQATRALAWGDYDGDGDLDLAVGNYGERDQVWRNSGGGFPSAPTWTSDEADKTTCLAWGDWDGDGDLDLAVGRDGQQDVVYSNLGVSADAPDLVPLWLSEESQATTGLAWGDRDGDGDLDLAVSQRAAGGRSGYYENTLAAPSHLGGAEAWTAALPNNPPHLYVERPGETDDAYFYSAPEVLAGPGVPTVTVRYVLYDPEGDPVAATFFDYSPDGGGSWYPATPASSSPEPLAQTSPSGEEGTFVWDAGADDAVGDEVLFRVRVVPGASIGPVQRGQVVAVSPPFRIKALDCYWPVGAAIQGAPEHVAVDEEVTLRAYLESASGAIRYLWDFGDGEEASGIEVTHQYRHNGTFTVTLTVEGEACPIARPAYARAVIVVGTGIPDRLVYLPLVLRGYGESGEAGGEATRAAARPVGGGSRPFALAGGEQVGAQQVTNFSLGVSSQPSLSDDGSRVVFWSTWPGETNGDGSIEIVLAEIHSDDSVEYTAVTSSTGSILGGFNLSPSIDGAGERVVFFSDCDLTGENPDRNFEIFLAEVGGAEVSIVQVTKTSRGLNVLPDISSDGRYLAFVSNQDLTGENADGRMEIFRAEVGAGEAITLTQVTHSGDEVNDQPSISGNGRYIAFVATVDGGRQLRLADVGGETVTLTTIITAGGSINEQPSISRDGKRIVFISDRTGVRQVFLAEIGSGSSLTITQITSDGSDKNQPTISADGKRVAYVAIVGANDRQLRLYDLVDKDEVNTQAGNHTAYPGFNADGTTVAFVSDGDILLREYPLADLSLSKWADKGEVQEGDNLLYTLRIANTLQVSGSVAHGVTVVDYLPQGVDAGLPMTLTDYCDDDNDAEGFGGGTHSGTNWDVGNEWVGLTATYNPFALPNGGGVDEWFNMTGNVMLLHLDEAAGVNTFADSSTEGNDGSCSSPGCPYATGGKLNGAMHFDGEDDYIEVSHSTSISLNRFTVGLWVRPTEIKSDHQTLIDKEYGSTHRNYGLFISRNSMRVRYTVHTMGAPPNCSYIGLDSVGSLVFNRWNHVVMTFDGNRLRLYLNGRLDSSVEVSEQDLCVNTGAMVIGGGGDYLTLSGDIDEVFIFDHALGDDEILSIYQRQAPLYAGYFDSRVMGKENGVGRWSLLSWLPYRPTGRELPDYIGVESGYPADGFDMSGNVLLWHLDESGPPFRDTSGKGNDGSCSGASCPQTGTDGRLGTALRFDGSDDYVIVNPVSEFPADEITAMFWVRDEEEGGESEESYLSYATAAHSNEFWIFGKASYGGDICVIVGNASAGDSKVNVADGEWHHVAVTWRGFDGRLEVYKDGHRAYTGTLRQGYSLVDGGSLVLGQDQDRVGGGFNDWQALLGSLDEVAIFNRVLTPDEVLAAYLRGALQMQFQVRTCDNIGCSQQLFMGPSGWASFYTADGDDGLTPPSLSLNVVDRNYIQYRVYLGTYDPDYSPALREARIWPDVQCAGGGVITCELTPLAPGDPPVSIGLPVTVTRAAYGGATRIGGESYLVNVAQVDAEESDHSVQDNTGTCYTHLRPVAPTGVTIVGPTVGSTGVAYAFTATVAPTNTTAPITYTWWVTGYETQHVGGVSDVITYTWTSTGPKVIRVEAVNEAQAMVSDAHVINVEEPIAGLTAVNDGPTLLGEETRLTATVTAGSGVSYHWSFGDGQTGSGPVITHTYRPTGTYTAVVTASNSVSVMTATTTVVVYSTTVRMSGGGVGVSDSLEYNFGRVGVRSSWEGVYTPGNCLHRILRLRGKLGRSSDGDDPYVLLQVIRAVFVTAATLTFAASPFSSRGLQHG